MEIIQASGNGRSYGSRGLGECDAPTSTQAPENVGSILNETDKLTAEIAGKAQRLADILHGPIPSGDNCKQSAPTDIRTHLASHRASLYHISEELSRALRAIEG